MSILIYTAVPQYKKRRVSPFRWFALLSAVFLLFYSIPAAGATMNAFTETRAYQKQFQDVPEDAWYAPYVVKTYQLELLNGLSEHWFAPTHNISIAQTITLSARIHAQYHGNEISPAEGEWYTKYVQYAVNNHIIDNSYLSANYLDNRLCSRLDFAWILAFALPAKELTVVNKIDDNAIPDLSSDQEGALAVYALYGAGILTGSDKYGSFYPEETITRAEAATIVSRMVDTSLRETFSIETVPTLKDIQHTLPDSMISAMETRIYQENIFGAIITSNREKGAILTRENWNDFEKLIQSGLAGYMDFEPLLSVGKYIGKDPLTNVSKYTITKEEFQQWVNFSYGVTSSGVSIKNNSFISYGNQCFVGEKISVQAVYPCGENTYYVRFDRRGQTEPFPLNGFGYAVLHWTDGHYQVYELGWDTEEMESSHYIRYLSETS